MPVNLQIPGPSAQERQFFVALTKYDATDENSVKLFDDMLNSGININVVHKSYGTPLHAAIARKLIPVIDKLLEKGADVNARDLRGRTPLFALFYGYYLSEAKRHMIEEFLDQGADLDIPDKKGNVLLHIACKRKDYDLAIFLLEKGSKSYNAKDEDGNTPFMLIIKNENKFTPDAVSTLDLLLEKGADLDIRDNFRKSPLEVAFDLDSWRKRMTKTNWGPVIDKDWRFVVYLAEHGAEPVSYDERFTGYRFGKAGFDILKTSMGRKNVDLVATLLLRGLARDISTGQHLRYVELNLSYLGPELVPVFTRLLLIAGANPDVMIDTRLSLLDYLAFTAVEGRYISDVGKKSAVEMLKLLVEYGASIKDTTSSFWKTEEGQKILNSRESRVPSLRGLALRVLKERQIQNPYVPNVMMDANELFNSPEIDPEDGVRTLEDWIRKYGSATLNEILNEHLAKKKESTDASSSSEAASSSSSSSLSSIDASIGGLRQASASQIRSFLVACKQGDSELVSSLLEETPSLANAITGTGKTVPEFVLHVGQDHLLPIVTGN